MPQTPSIDGVSPAAAVPPADPASQKGAPLVMKMQLLLALAVPYAVYIVWCLFLLASYPAQDASGMMIAAGVFTTIIGALAFIAIGAFGFLRISQSKALPNAKLMALLKLGAFVLPGIVVSVLTPFSISAQPTLRIDIVSPTSASQLVAPLAMTFSAEGAVESLTERGFKPIQYQWDINGDKKPDQQTLDPQLTATFDREGVYTVTVAMKAADGSVKGASRRFVISQSVFSVTPLPAVVDRPAVFSLAHLYIDPKEVTAVAWDFDGDGSIDEENGGIQTSYTYLATGSYDVTAVVLLANKTQQQYRRTVDVQEEAPLAFPVSIVTQPRTLIGTKPFPVLFTVETLQPVYSVQWDFGDGQKAEGQRAAHTFAREGSFAVVAKVRSQSGVVVDISTVVRVVERLDIPDLQFEGSHPVQSGKISGEVPMTIDLTPVTQTPFVQFSWEAPDATEVGSTDGHLQAIYRRAGTYTITLVAQDLENHVLRLPITVEVQPPSSLVSFRMDPESGVAPLTVKFDASESTIPGEDITGFVWDFRDGSKPEYGGAFTQHTFPQAGTYTIGLTAKTTSGREQTTTRTLIVRSPSLQSRILPSRLNGSAPLTVEFDGQQSVGVISSYQWDFDDGTQNDAPSVEHTFLDPGSYTVTLTVKDPSGASAVSTVTITVQ